jgi:tetratricopeptide (TPR) repeat protein
MHAFGQITYGYYADPEKIGSSNPLATEYFIKSFEFVMQWGTEDIDSAILYMQKAIQEDSLYAIAYASLGHFLKTYRYDGSTVDLDTLESLAETAINLDPTVADAYTLQSWIYVMNGELEKAINANKKAVEAEPDHRETWFWLGMSYFQVSKLDSAIYSYNKALEVDPTFGQPHMKLGWLYSSTGNTEDIEKAAYHFRKVISLYEDIEPRDERMIQGYQFLGAILISQHKYYAAIDTFNLLLDKTKNTNLHWIKEVQSDAYNGLVDCYLSLAHTEAWNLIDLNMSVLDEDPDDLGKVATVMSRLENLKMSMVKQELNDTLDFLSDSLYELLVTANSVDLFILLDVINSRFERLWDKEDYEKIGYELGELVQNYCERKDVLGNLYFLWAVNWILQSDEQKTIQYLKMAVDAGYKNKAGYNNPIFEIIHDNPEFIEILERLK